VKRNGKRIGRGIGRGKGKARREQIMKVKSSYEPKHKQTSDIMKLQIHYAQTFRRGRYECEMMPEKLKT